jgi:hypothetical protein
MQQIFIENRDYALIEEAFKAHFHNNFFVIWNERNFLNI